MSWLVLGLIALVVVYALARNKRKSKADRMVTGFRFAAAFALLGVAVLLGVSGKWAIAVPIGLFAVSLLGYSGSWSTADRKPPPETGPRSRRRSSVSTALFAMELDHGTGEIRGRVIAGPYAGSDLDLLTFNDLAVLWRGIDRADRESRSLLEAYLDRREPGWREDLKQDPGPRQSPPSRPGSMSAQEAYEALGLRPGATESEIRIAHRSLMKRVHPDMGGSAALAAKINEAKERLLSGHQKR